jgi:hypothetical protein
MKYTVIAYDNFHYVEGEYRTVGEFDSISSALDACKKVVDESLAEAVGADAKELKSYFNTYGEVPSISCNGDIISDVFKPYEYAKLRCEEIARKNLM